MGLVALAAKAAMAAMVRALVHLQTGVGVAVEWPGLLLVLLKVAQEG
jgi:hypothetical protein